ncbi:MAG: nitroreductase/quinone reductase family protein [Mycobacterium sp.]|nr:nitroreductase/quinone reductase family protein [Mycobacterium sp.]
MTNPDRTIKPPRWLKPLNRVFLLLRRVGAMKDMHVLTVAGRRTGKLRSTPLTVVQLDDIRYLLEGFPGADWARNVRAADGRAQLAANGTTENVRLVELDAEAAVPVLRQWPEHAADGSKIMKDAGIVDDVTADAFATLAGRCAVFRIEST